MGSVSGYRHVLQPPHVITFTLQVLRKNPAIGLRTFIDVESNAQDCLGLLS